MAPLRMLRAASWTLFLSGALHLLGHFSSARQFNAPTDAPTAALVQAMKAYIVHDYPIDRSMASLYFGFSLSWAAMCMLVAALVLAAANLLHDNPAALRKIARLLMAGLLVLSSISVLYFIWPPTICLLTAFGFAALATNRLRRAAQ